MKIGELANEVGISTKAIRYYESIGILHEPERTPGGYRIYDDAAVERLDFIKQAQSASLSLTEIQSVLRIKDRGGQSCMHTRALLDDHLDELDAKILELQSARVQLARLADRAATLDPDDCTDANSCQIIAADPVTTD